MFGGLGKSSVDHRRSVLELLNDDRLASAQKSDYCFDQGICDGCGVKTHWVGPFKRRPRTDERVLNGVCRSCHPEKCNATKPRPADSWQAMQKFVVPPDVLLAKTIDTFSGLQSSVTERINTINDVVNGEKAKVLRNGTSEGLGNVSSSVANGINTINDHFQTTRKMGLGQTTIALNHLQSSMTRGLKNIKIKAVQANNQSKERKTALSSLHSTFKTNSEETKNKANFDDTTLYGSETAPTEESAFESLLGKDVITPFGKGKVFDYRKEDEMFVIDLHYHSWETKVTLTKGNNTKLFCKRESFEIERENKSRQKQVMELNEAYESLEKMRLLNLEVQCHEIGLIEPIDFNKCTTCLLNTDQDSSQQKPQSFQSIRKMMQDQKKAATPCLFCAAPVCRDHSCPTFRKERIMTCLDCVKLLESDYIVECINHAHGLSAEHSIAEHSGGETNTELRPLDHMIDLYDRVLLLLQYSSQYIDSISAALEENRKTSNNVNVGASSVGIVSGALGVAAAAALFTPVGPSLLIASLMLGGGSTAAQTGTEVANYLSETSKFADKILALVAMVHSVLRVKESLREILTARLLAQQGHPEIDRLRASLDNMRMRQRGTVVKAGTTVFSTAVLGGVAMTEVAAGAAAVESAALVSSVEVGALAGRNANMLSKSGTVIARGARFARFAGGALSAATMILEARTMHNTVEQIRKGNPCEKANALRAILKEMPSLPTTEQLDEECRIYVGAMSNRLNANILEDAIRLIERKAIEEWQVTKAQVGELNGEMAPVGVSILDGVNDDDPCEWQSVTGALSASLYESPTPPDHADSVATPPAPRMIQASSTETNQSNHFATRAKFATRMTQSTSALPSDAITPSKQSALISRIKKFKQAESLESANSKISVPPDAFVGGIDIDNTG